MTREEVTICKAYLNDLDGTHDCNEYKLLMALLEQQPCEDAVSRQMVIEYIKVSDAELGHESENESVVEDIMDMPPVTPTQKWILTSERQPKENGNYLALYRTSDGTASLEFMMVDHCNAGGGWLHEENGRKAYKKVIAWQPLPKPYREDEE